MSASLKLNHSKNCFLFKRLIKFDENIGLKLQTRRRKWFVFKKGKTGYGLELKVNLCRNLGVLTLLRQPSPLLDLIFPIPKKMTSFWRLKNTFAT